MKKYLKILCIAVMAVLCISVCPLTAQAKEDQSMTEDEFLSMYANAKTFDPAYYAATYPDVNAVYGYAEYALYYHYTAYGVDEGRLACEGAEPGAFAKWKMTPLEAYIKVTSRESGVAEKDLWNYLYGGNIPWNARQSEIDKKLKNWKPASAASTAPEASAPVDGIVPIDQLPNYKAVKKNMTDEEFQAAYNEALKIVTPLVGLSQEEQLKGICSTLRTMAEGSDFTHSSLAAHYNDAYGYLINHCATCAGSVRTTGLCLNMLGMSYEHVNENQWTHQWCRVNIDGVIWVADPYGPMWAPETAPYAHPLMDN